ncbi:MAG TPA: hypothetical protein ENH86_02520 [Candidatus Jorgensenbacteria bacterium]|nr:hypothetical protein [Candidatus Jorgensenbacteria bacterium]
MHLEVLTEKGKEIFSRLDRFNKFYLAGGTALALQIGHRASIDFDLFSKKEIQKDFLSEIEEAFPGENISVVVNNPDEVTVFVSETKVTFLKYPFPLIYDLVNYESVNLATIKEIAGIKAYTIGRRGSFKDYVDLYFILSEKYFSLNEIIDVAEKKYGSDFNSRLFLEQLLYLEDITDTEIVFLKDSVDKKELRKFFEEEIKKIKI